MGARSADNPGSHKGCPYTESFPVGAPLVGARSAGDLGSHKGCPYTAPFPVGASLVGARSAGDLGSHKGCPYTDCGRATTTSGNPLSSPWERVGVRGKP